MEICCCQNQIVGFNDPTCISSFILIVLMYFEDIHNLSLLSIYITVAMRLKNKFSNLKILFCHIRTSYIYIIFKITNRFSPFKAIFKIELFKNEKPQTNCFVIVTHH